MKQTITYLLLLLAVSAGAQDNGSTVWKKEVSRIIDTRDIDKRIPKRKGQPVNLMGIITEAVKSGQLTARTSFVYEPSRVMTKDDIKRQFSTTWDSTSVVDPVTGKITITVSHRDFDPESVYKYRITEQWSFNPVAGKMDVQITSIGPMTEVYGEDGVYRGNQTLCKLNYKDLYTLLQQKDERLLQSLTNTIWQSYFATDSNTHYHPSAVNGILHTNATVIADLNDPEDTVSSFLRNERDDTALVDLMMASIGDGTFPAWAGDTIPFSRQLTPADISVMGNPAPVDTIPIPDPVTGVEILTMTRTHRPYSPTDKYVVLENWALNTIEGKTEITIKGIAPIVDNNNEPQTLVRRAFWVTWKDLQSILSRTEPYHPAHTFAMQVWGQHFAGRKNRCARGLSPFPQMAG